MNDEIAPGRGQTSREDAVLRWLEFYRDADHEAASSASWSLPRVAWRAGELHLEAASSLLEQLLRGAGRQGQYALVWGLARCGSPGSIESLRLYSEERGFVGCIAREGLRRGLRPAARELFLAQHRATLSEDLRDALEGDSRPLAASTLPVDALATLYLIDEGDLHAALVERVATANLHARDAESIDELYHAAVFREDSRMFGVCALRVETSAQAWSGRRGQRARRRARTTLRRLADLDGSAYVAMASGLMVAFEEEMDELELVAWVLDQAREQAQAWREASTELKSSLSGARCAAVRRFAQFDLGR